MDIEDRLQLIDTRIDALTSSLSCLVSGLQKTGAIDDAKLVDSIQATALANRAQGNLLLAAQMAKLANYLLSTIPAHPLRTDRDSQT